MSFPSDVSDDEMSLLDLLNFSGSPELCIPLTDESTGMIHVSPMNEANPLMSSQQSNRRTYKERSTVLPNPLEMIMHQQQLDNSHETWLQPPPSALARRQDDLHNLRMVNISDLTYPMQNQINRIPNLNVVLENNISFTPMPQMPPNSIRPQMFSNFTRISNLNVVPENNISFIPMPQMPPYSIRPQMSYNFIRIPNLNVVPENNIPFIPRPQMFSNFTRIPTLNVVPENNISLICMPQMPPNYIMPQMFSNFTRPQMFSNFTRISNLNVVPENNISFIPRPQIPQNFIRPQMSSNSRRHHGNMQRSVNQSLLRFRFSTQICPSANSTIPLPSEVLGSRRRSYQSRFEFGQSSSPVQRRRISTDENVASTSINPVEPRLINRVYNPLYESLGISIDPHLRKFSDMKNE